MKPDMSVMLGIGKKPPKGEAPPPMAGKKAPAPTPQPEPEEPEDHGGRIPAQAVGYHGEAERCDACAHFVDGNCARLEMAVEPGGHCALFEGNAPEPAQMPQEMPEVA